MDTEQLQTFLRIGLYLLGVLGVVAIIILLTSKPTSQRIDAYDEHERRMGSPK